MWYHAVHGAMNIRTVDIGNQQSGLLGVVDNLNLIIRQFKLLIAEINGLEGHNTVLCIRALANFQKAQQTKN